MGCAAKREMSPVNAPEAPAAEPAPEQVAAGAQDTLAAAPVMGEAAAAAPPAPAAQPATKAASAPASAPQRAKTSADRTPLPGEPNVRPMLVYEAQVGVLVDESRVADTIEKIIDAAESKGGYLVSRSDQAVSVRVPSSQLRAALADIEPLGRVTRRSVTAQDVSDQYHDLEVRLKSLEAVRERLVQFLSRASNMSEAMTIAAQLDQVAQQIDQVKGDMQLLRTRAAYSLIQVSVQPKPPVVVAQPQPPPQPPTARPARLPVDWLHRVGLDSLTRLDSND